MANCIVEYRNETQWRVLFRRTVEKNNFASCKVDYVGINTRHQRGGAAQQSAHPLRNLVRADSSAGRATDF